MTGKTFLLFILIMFIPTIVSSEDMIEELHPNPVRKGYQFTLSFYIDYDNPSEVAVTAPEFPKEFKLVRGPYIRGYYVTLDSGKPKKKTKIQYIFSASKTGRFVLGAFEIRTGNKVFKTSPRVMGVGLYKNKNIYIPYEVSWIRNKGAYYVGEVIPLIAVVSNLPDILFFEKIEVPPPASGLFTKIDDPGPITERVVGSEKLYNVPVVGYLFTPSRDGIIKIPRVRVSAAGITSLSSTFNLKINPLPADVSSTGAVGKFKRLYRIESGTAGINENVEVHVVVKGTGNLNYLEIPPPFGNGMTLIGEKDEQNYIGTLSGYSGEREKIFTFVASSAGDKTIKIPPFPFLDPESDMVHTETPVSLSVKISGSPVQNQDESTDWILRFKPEKISGTYLPLKSGKYLEIKNYLWLLPGPVVFLVLFFLRKKKVLLISLILFIAAGDFTGASIREDGISLYQDGRYNDSIRVYLDELAEYPDSSSLYYNLALSYYKTGSIGKAVYAAEVATFYNPLKKTYTELLHAIEESAEIEYPVAIPRSIYPDSFLFILTLFLNMAGFVGVVYLIKRKNFYFIISVLLLSLSVITFGGFVYSAVQWRSFYGIAYHNKTEVKRIPQKESEVGFTLVEGETVRIVGSAGEYDFIENGIGLKGWVERDFLLLLGGEIDPYKVLKAAE